jgi:hypothetical protein
VKSDEREEGSVEIEATIEVAAGDRLEVALSRAMPEMGSSVIEIRMCQPGGEVATEVGVVLLIRTVERRAVQQGGVQRMTAQRSQEITASHVRLVDELRARISSPGLVVVGARSFQLR